MTQRGQLRAGSDRAQYPPRPLRRRPAVGDLAGEPRAGDRQLVDAVGDAVLGEVGQVGPERVRLDGVATGGEVGVVDLAYDVRACDAQDLVAALVAFEVVEPEVVR